MASATAPKAKGIDFATPILLNRLNSTAKLTSGNPFGKAEAFQFLRFDFFSNFVCPDCTSQCALQRSCLLPLDKVHKGRESKQQADEQQSERSQIDPWMVGACATTVY